MSFFILSNKLYSHVLQSLVEYVAPAPLVTTEVLMGRYPMEVFFVSRSGSPKVSDFPVVLLEEFTYPLDDRVHAVVPLLRAQLLTT